METIRRNLAMAMLVAIVSEMWTGIRASKVQGIGFESFRFSRCICGSYSESTSSLVYCPLSGRCGQYPEMMHLQAPYSSTSE